MATVFATATFEGAYCGETTIRLVGFTTKRKGVRVTRYRWEGDKDEPRFTAPFSLPAVAISAVRRDRRVSDVATTEAYDIHQAECVAFARELGAAEQVTA